MSKAVNNRIIMNFGIEITSYPLTALLNKLLIFMHNIVLHISIYSFPLLHVLGNLGSINNDMRF